MGFSWLCVKQKVWPSFVVISTSASDIVGYILKTIMGQIHWIIWGGERGEEIMLINVLLSNGSSNIYICVWWEFDCVIFPPFIMMSDSHLVGIWLVGICWVTVIADDTVCVWYIASTLVILQSSSNLRHLYSSAFFNCMGLQLDYTDCMVMKWIPNQGNPK